MEVIDCLAVHDLSEVGEAVEALETALLAPGVVGREAVVAAALDVQGGEVHAVARAGGLERRGRGELYIYSLGTAFTESWLGSFS